MRDFTKADIEVKYARLLGLLDSIQNEANFSRHDGDEAIRKDLQEARDIVRSMQDRPAVKDLVMEPI